jgi:molybdopterin molybdotransferase
MDMTILQKMDVPSCGCDGIDVVDGLMPIDTALNLSLGLVHTVANTEIISLAQATGRVLAAPILAPTMLPAFDNSGMDGYAVRIGDLPDSGPWKLPVADRIAAGDKRNLELPLGSAVRIFTGAPVPKGADAVIMQERVSSVKDVISSSHRPIVGENIRRAGEDRAKGAEILHAGHRFNTRSIAAAASAGAGDVIVHCKTRVAILMTGDEAVPTGMPLPAGAIWDVNTPMLRAALDMPNVEIVAIEHVEDTVQALVDRFDQLSLKTDLIITTGGVSVGEEDHAHEAVHMADGHIAVSRVAIKPGKPITVGRIRKAVYLGLPGNPVSAFVTWTVFGKPILNKLSGARLSSTKRRYVKSFAPIKHKLGRCEYRPASVDGIDGNGMEVIQTLPATHSARLGPLTMADGLVLIPADTETIAVGDLIEFLPFCEN